MLHLLVVDDRPGIKEEIEETLRLRMGYEVSIDLRVPTKRATPFGCELPVGKELERFDAALVDLELFPPESQVQYRESDLRGGTEILPYLRQEAPWLPVLAVSRLLTGQPDYFLAVVGGFGFDGYLPQGIFSGRSILRESWDDILKRARALRRRALLGDSAYGERENSVPVIEVDGTLAGVLDSVLPNWRTLVGETFVFARSVILEQMTPGFSGATVLKAYTRAPETGACFEGEWVLKMSPSPRKLHVEATAHLRLLRNGFPFARIVPLLWPGVLVHDRLGAIAYKFASGAVTAAGSLIDGMSPELVCERIANVVTLLYRDAVMDRRIVGDLLRPSLRLERIRGSILTLGSCRLRPALDAIVNGSAYSELSKSVLYRRGYVHGDLHCGNIMFGSPDVLIDFAWSGPGCLAMDAAKLVSDLLMRVKSLQSPTLPTWSTLPDSLRTLNAAFELTTEEFSVFDMALPCYLLEALSYDGVSDETKEWIRRAVEAT